MTGALTLYPYPLPFFLPPYPLPLLTPILRLYLVSPKPFLMIYIFLEQIGIEQILDNRGACHQAGNPEKSGWKVIVKVIFSEIPTKHLGLRFEIVQSFRSVWTRQNVAYHLSFPAV